MLRIICSTSAARRLDAAHVFLARRPPAAEVTIIGASRGAADDFVRAAARTAGATFGLSRFSLTELAARAAAIHLSGTRRVPGTQAGAEAIAARAVFDAVNADELEYFAPVASMPGFSKALARTLHELRLAGVEAVRLKAGTADTTVRLKPDTTYVGSAVDVDATYGDATGGVGATDGEATGGVGATYGDPTSGVGATDGDATGGVGATDGEATGAVGENVVIGGTADVEDKANADIGRLLARVEEQLARAGVDDRAALFRVAADGCRAGVVRWAESPIIFLDVPIDSRAEREFVAALVERSPDTLATVPDGDHIARAALVALGGRVEEIPEVSKTRAGEQFILQTSPRILHTSDVPDLPVLRSYIFAKEPPPARERSGDVRLFSAPGEGREAVEIVRRVLDEAAAGVPFDEMAVCLRTPQSYAGLLEHACARGDVPVYFDRGTRRPDPAGRAFVALLSCAVDGLSAKRFDEYLSLGQVPPVGRQSSVVSLQSSGDRRPPTDDRRRSTDDRRLSTVAGLGPSASGRQPPIVSPSDEVFRGLDDDDLNLEPESEPDHPDSDAEAVVAGTLRSPWKWEELIVESSVVGGRTRADGAARWRRRLDGLAADFGYRLRELRGDEPDSPRIARLERDLRNLQHLRHFALPIIGELAEWPERALWREWLDRFASLAVGALARPTRVLQTLADLRPMESVGPVALEEARDVLHDRLVTLDWEPPVRRYGRLFVGTPHQARGRRFRVVFVPGLAERVVPQRPREDPLLLDDRRRALDPALMLQEARGTAERLLLKIAIGAASERLYLSYPRLDVAETRARVPSFYALDVMRAITGRVPDHRVLASEAAEEGDASLAWPAPKNPDRAIDDLEHDLAILKPLLDSRPLIGVAPDAAASVRGRAHYMLDLNPALRRSVISRWARGRGAWSPSDGLIRVSPGTAPALASHRLANREYSLSALQRFATCPYQFLLATIYRLEPWDEPEPIVRMDPLTRGSLYHKAQAEFFRAMKQSGDLPVVRQGLPAAAATLGAVLDRVAADYAEALAPAIDRVWRDEIDELRRDLGIWVQKLADVAAWVPRYFEFSFGLADEGRDAESLKGAIELENGFKLRGSVDLIEHDPGKDVLRVTDHKTGKNRSNPDLIVGGGSVLQPVLYSVAVERGLGRKVVAGRLFYSTTVGGFVEHEIPIDDYTRGQGLQVLAIIDRAVEMGFLPAAPAERACTWCDFRPVCGPREEARTARKAQDKLADLKALRSMR